jgi:hypothetical protein
MTGNADPRGSNQVTSSRDRLLARLSECAEMDEETGHIEADKALLEYIGDVEVSAAFRSFRKWYA